MTSDMFSWFRRRSPLFVLALIIPAHFRGVVEAGLGEFAANVSAILGILIAALIVIFSEGVPRDLAIVGSTIMILGGISAVLTIFNGLAPLVTLYLVPFVAIVAVIIAMYPVRHVTFRRTLELYLVVYGLASVAVQLWEMTQGTPILPGTRLHEREFIRSAGFTGAKQVHGIQTAVLAMYFLSRGSLTKGRRRWVFFLLAATLALASALTYTRAGLLIIALFILFSALLVPHRLAPLTSAGIGAAMLTGIMLPRAYITRAVSTFDPSAPGNETRIEMWRQSLEQLAATPLIVSNRFGSGSQATKNLWESFGGGHGENFVYSMAVNIGVPAAILLMTIFILSGFRRGPEVGALWLALAVQAFTYMTLESSAVLATLLIASLAWPSRLHSDTRPGITSRGLPPIIQREGTITTRKFWKQPIRELPLEGKLEP